MIAPLARRGGALLGCLALAAGLLSACGQANTVEPTATRDWPTLAATVPASPTVDPLLPSGDGAAGQVIGANNPTQAALAAEGQPSQEPPTPTTPPTQEALPMSISAADGTVLQATYYSPAARPAPAVLLIHQVGGSQQDWAPLVPLLHDTGYAVMTFDLRGHGASGGTPDWTQAPGDVAAVLGLLGQLSGVDASQIVLAGASIGANLALNACVDAAGCAAAVLLSPGLDYRGITTAPAIPRLNNRPLLIVASENDDNNPADSLSLDQMATGDHELIVLAGAGHGAAMFAAEPALAGRLRDWIVARVPPPGLAVTPIPGGS